MNPARPSLIVAQLFEPGAATAELREPVDAALLYPLEAARCRGFAPKRIAEFTAGRLCARRALKTLGIDDFPVDVNADRSPRWPAGVVGSITHTVGYCCAVVASQSTFGGIGVDVETNGRVSAEIEPLVMTGPESTFLASLSELERAYAATIIFSAKESYYKCQYPLSLGWLDFLDVSLELVTDDLRSGSFIVRPQRAAPAFANGPRLPLRGRFRTDGTLTFTGISLYGDFEP